MDRRNLNMRQHRWLDVAKDYDCEIPYHPEKANVVANALSRKVARALVRGLCLRMINISPLLDLIREAQVEGIRRENWKK